MGFRRTSLIVLFLAAACWPGRSFGCFAIIVGRAASADGSVLVGHNEQNYGQRILNFRRIPSQRFPRGATFELRRGGVLPQVGQTAAFLWSENPGLEFSDAYLNQHGVAVLSDGCGSRESDYDTLVRLNEIRHGGIGGMLRRLVAQRARSAREGVELAGKLIERFGYVDSGRTYVIADSKEAWLLAVVRGRRWVAQRVPDDAVVLLPNVYVIGEVDLSDTENFLGSKDLIDYAAGRGWFDVRSGRPLNFRQAYRRDRDDRPDPRRWWARQLVSGKEVAWPPDEPPPLGIRQQQKMTVAMVAKILRDTRGPERTLSSPVTQEGTVLQLRDGLPREIGCVWWRITAEPASGVLLPWYLGITATPRSFYRPVDVQTQLSLKHHFEPPPETFEPFAGSAWWTFKRLQDRGNVKRARAHWAPFEQRTFEQQMDVERKALQLWQDDSQSARRYLTEYCHELAAEALREAEELTARLRHTRSD